MRAVVLLNRYAGAGKARRMWPMIASKIVDTLEETPDVYDETRDWGKCVADACRTGRCLVVAAGGDGTVHRAANLVLSLPARARSRAVLGAVGLGSSNDFHKPTDRWDRIAAIPVRCSPRRTARQDVLRVESVNTNGERRIRYAVTSASVGMIALGNSLFNRRWGLVGACRRFGPALGIWSAAVASLCLQRGIPVKLSIDGAGAYDGQTCLLGFYVNRHMGGRLRYPRGAGVVSPGMGVSLLPGVGILRRAHLLVAAAGNGLPGPPRTLLWCARTCRCTCERPTPLEMDGEVTDTREVRIRLVPGALRVCA